MNRVRWSPVAACAALAAIAGVAALVPTASSSEEPPPPRPRVVSVVKATATCPELRQDKDTATWGAIAAPGRRSADDGTGVAATTFKGETVGEDSAELVELRSGQEEFGDPEPKLLLARPGAETLELRPKAATSDGSAGALAFVGRAQGALAPGFDASFVTRTARGDLRGLASATCASTSTNFWFVGSGAVIGQRGQLFLTNPGGAAAVADVTLYGPDGPIQSVKARGVSVEAHGQRVLQLDGLSPATTRFGMHVQVRQGRLAAALRDHQVRGLDPRGVDWVPPASPPAARVVIPGVPDGDGKRLLQILTPGDADAIVRVRLLADDGSFVPSEVDVLEVAAQSVGEFDLSRQLAGREMGIELTSDVPITAGLLARTDAAKGEVEELAYTAATAALTAARPGVVAPGVLARPARAHLTLAAPEDDVTVRIVLLGSAKGTNQVVRVPAGAQVSFDLERVSKEPGASVLVAPDRRSGPVVVTRIVAENDAGGRMLTISPIMPGRYEVAVRPVVADVSTGLRLNRCTPTC